LVALLAVVAGLALRRRCTSFFLVLEFFLRVLDWFWIFVPATPATYALLAGIQWVAFVSMPALYVYSSMLLGRKLPRGHAGPFEKCRDGRGVDTALVFTLDWRYLATYAVQKAPSSSPRPKASSITCAVV
jgi:hypothetical protein